MSPTGEPNPRAGDHAWPRGDGIDELLGLDPTPSLSRDAMRAIHARLARDGDGALDALLGMDEVDVPDGLAAGVLTRVASERRAAIRRRRMRLVPLIATAAAAGVAFVVFGGGDETSTTVDDGPTVADAGTAGAIAGGDHDGLEVPSDDFLAALPALENMEFLTEELDPLEADALFLLDDEDALLLDLLEMGG